MPQSVDVVKCHQLPPALKVSALACAVRQDAAGPGAAAPTDNAAAALQVDSLGRLKVTEAAAAYSNVALSGLTWVVDVSISPLDMTGFDAIDFSIELNNAGGTASTATITAEVSCDGGTTYYPFADFGSTEVSISGADSWVIRGALQGIPRAHIQFTQRESLNLAVKSPSMVRQH